MFESKSNGFLKAALTQCEDAIDQLHDDILAIEERAESIRGVLRERTGCDCFSLGLKCEGHSIKA